MKMSLTRGTVHSGAKSHQNMEFLERLNEPEFDSILVKSKIIDFNTNNYSKLI